MGTGTELVTKGKSNNVSEPDEEMMKLLKEMYGKNLTDLEFKTLIYIAKKYDLDPIQHEIWAIKYGNEPAKIMTGRDGFLSIAHKTGQLNGLETLAITKDGSVVPTCLNPKELAGAVCKVWRKDMQYPFVVAVALHEYNTGKSNWSKMPETMIKKVAESQVLRRAFNISGLYAPEEMEQAQTQTITEKVVEEFPEFPYSDAAEPIEVISEGATEFPVEKVATEKQLKAIWAGLGKLSRKLEKEKDELEDTLKKFYKVEHLQELTPEQASKAIENINKQLNKG